VRPRARSLLVAFTLATLATVLVAAPAHAVEVKQQTHLVAQFKSGHTGWFKIALEKDTSNNKARAHLGVWCQNASGTKVHCGAVEGNHFGGRLSVEHWDETYGWQPDINANLVDYSEPDPPLTLNIYTQWACTGEGNDQYRAAVFQVRIIDAFGEPSGWKDRTHPTWLGSFC
jgi:hypothetical protein